MKCCLRLDLGDVRRVALRKLGQRLEITETPLVALLHSFLIQFREAVELHDRAGRLGTGTGG